MNVNLALQSDFTVAVGEAQERAVTAGPELTVVIPTLNERDNIEPLVELLDGVLDTVSWEVIFVDDDSPDGTAERIREIGRRPASALPSAHRAAGPHDGLHRRRPGNLRGPSHWPGLSPEDAGNAHLPKFPLASASRAGRKYITPSYIRAPSCALDIPIR